MASLRNTMGSAATGAVGALSGLIPLAACSGASCASCAGCVGVGAGVLTLLLIKKYLIRSKDHGMAETVR